MEKITVEVSPMFWVNIRELRRRWRVTQGRVGELLGISRQSYNHLENQKTRLSFERFMVLCAIFDLVPEEEVIYHWHDFGQHHKGSADQLARALRHRS